MMTITKADVTRDIDELIDPVYLPFTVAQLARHFAPTAGGGDPKRHVTYYLGSKANRREFQLQQRVDGVIMDPKVISRGHQIEKDERFWVVSALMSLFYSTDRVAALTQALTRSLGPVPPMEGFSSWAEALGEKQELYFEVNLNSPNDYRQKLFNDLDERLLKIPYLREAAKSRRLRLEGATKVDAVLLSPDTGFAVLFEAKVLSDTSCSVEFDPRRNQIARNIDVMLDANPNLAFPLNVREPDRTCFVLITPEAMQKDYQSRLYGWLYYAYKHDPELLSAHLPHRPPEQLAAVPARLGWLTWEDAQQVAPGACRWLDT